jgi:hypothetical protein
VHHRLLAEEPGAAPATYRPGAGEYGYDRTALGPSRLWVQRDRRPRRAGPMKSRTVLAASGSGRSSVRPEEETGGLCSSAAMAASPHPLLRVSGRPHADPRAHRRGISAWLDILDP